MENLKRVAAMLATPLLASALILGNGPAHADNDKGKGYGKGQAKKQSAREDLRPGNHFADPQRVMVREYYAAEEKRGRCPPGLAKKNNGCMPPGQAKKWRQGQPLPRDVIFHEVPRDLVIKIGLPPEGYKYVRVARDILLIAAGTAMVIDAIEDLGRI